MISRRFAGKRAARLFVLVLAFVVALGILVARSEELIGQRFPPIGGNDLVAYWSAARLLLAGQNPYSPDALLEVQQAAGWESDQAIRVWSPPWTLALVLPLALLPFGVATLASLVLQVSIILASGSLLWRYFCPGDSRLWIGLIVAATFVPGLFSLRIGQISSWLLLGIVGFLWFERARKDLLAGAALALLLAKPHVTYLFWLVALWWAWRSRRWRELMGWTATLFVSSLAPALLAPDIFANYLETALKPLDFAPPTPGTWLRLLVGIELHWLQFVPSAVAGLAVLYWLLRRQGQWRWEQLAPPLLLASVSTTVYVWSNDYVVLLPAATSLMSHLGAMTPRTRTATVAIYALIQTMLVVQNKWLPFELFFIWFPLAFASLYWWGTRLGPPEPEQPATPMVG